MTECNGSAVGRIHSIQTLGALDGPGIRFTVFMQGCNLRCGCCHNPDTHSLLGGSEYTAEQIAKKATRYREYFGNEGGITLSGGEPLLQADFACELFSRCRELGINTCLDTSGSIMNDGVLRLFGITDRVLLDVKYTDDALYRKYAGCSLGSVLEFLSLLCERKIPVTLRQVIIPTLNDSEENARALKEIADKSPSVDKIELLPFRKMCTVKYEKIGIPFPFAHLPEPTREKMAELERIVNPKQ